MTAKEAAVFVALAELRDRFAAAAVTGMLSDPDCGITPAAGARIAYDWADALLAARSEQDSKA